MPYYNERSAFKSAQRRYDNLLPEDFERDEELPVKTCKTCENKFLQDRPTQHICEDCESAGDQAEIIP